MSTRSKLIILSAAASAILLLAACSLLTQAIPAAATPTPSPAMSATLAPQLEPPTSTPTAAELQSPDGPTATQSEVEQMMTQVQRGTAVAEWRGVPVMPGAFDAMDAQSLYTFWTMTPPSEVAAWYRQQLGQLGWKPSWLDSAEPVGGASMVQYESSSQRAFIMAQVQQGKTMVMLDITDK